jgi:hypothetical protein
MKQGGKIGGAGDSVPEQPQTTPDTVMHASVEHSFVLQGVLGLQGKVGELTAELRALHAKVDGLVTTAQANANDAKESAAAMQRDIASLRTWRNTIAVGAAVVVAICAALGGAVLYAIDKFADRITITMPAVIQAQPAQTQPAKSSNQPASR